jgi:hypothetical protein
MPARLPAWLPMCPHPGGLGVGARTHLAKDGRAPTRHHHPKEG